MGTRLKQYMQHIERILTKRSFDTIIMPGMQIREAPQILDTMTEKKSGGAAAGVVDEGAEQVREPVKV